MNNLGKKLPLDPNPQLIAVMEEHGLEERESDATGVSAWSHVRTGVVIYAQNDAQPTRDAVLMALLTAAISHGRHHGECSSANALKELMSPRAPSHPVLA